MTGLQKIAVHSQTKVGRWSKVICFHGCLFVKINKFRKGPHCALSLFVTWRERERENLEPDCHASIDYFAFQSKRTKWWQKFCIASLRFRFFQLNFPGMVGLTHSLGNGRTHRIKSDIDDTRNPISCVIRKTVLIRFHFLKFDKNLTRVYILLFLKNWFPIVVLTSVAHSKFSLVRKVSQSDFQRQCTQSKTDVDNDYQRKRQKSNKVISKLDFFNISKTS